MYVHTRKDYSENIGLVVRIWTELILSGQGSSAGSCEDGNEHSSFIKFHDLLRDHQFLKKESVTWS
jgi:hypothetical protein